MDDKCWMDTYIQILCLLINLKRDAASKNNSFYKCASG